MEMKIKYYMRGLGIGILITTIVLSFGGKKEKLTDKEIMARAGELGMVMKDESHDKLEEVLEQSLEREETGVDLVEGDKKLDIEEASDDEELSEPSGVDDDTNITDTDIVLDTDTKINTESETDTESEINAESETDTETDIDTDVDIDTNTDLDTDLDVDVQEPLEEDTEGVVQVAVTFTIARGMSSRQVSELLARQGLIEDSVDFDDYIKRQGKASVIRIGTYTLPSDSTYQEILNAITG